MQETQGCASEALETDRDDAEKAEPQAPPMAL